MIDKIEDLLESLYATGKRRDVGRIEASLLASYAAAQMADEEINLLVVIGTNGEGVGVVSTSDTSREFGMSSIRPSERLVSDIMTPASRVITVNLNDKINEVARVNPLHKIRHVVVTDSEGRWIAILNSNEILDAVMKNITEEEDLKRLGESEFRT